MSQELAVIGQNRAVADWTQNREQIELLKRTICKDSTDDEFQLFVHVAKRSGLDPFARQIHAVKRWNDKAGRFDMSIQVGIDGFRLIADRTGQYAGNDDPVFDNDKNPTKATVTVYKIVGGVRCPFTATARWSEYFPGEKQGFMWKKMPCVMLGKVAESLALRKAFPAELSGLYTNEEMEQANTRRAAPGKPDAGDGIEKPKGFRGAKGYLKKKSPAEIPIEEAIAEAERLEAKESLDQDELQILDRLQERIALHEAMEPEESMAPKDPGEPPVCCGKKMLLSKFPDKKTGVTPFWCTECKIKVYPSEEPGADG